LICKSRQNAALQLEEDACAISRGRAQRRGASRPQRVHRRSRCMTSWLENHPQLVHSTIAKLYDTIRWLKEMPNRGRPGREEGTREPVFAPLASSPLMMCAAKRSNSCTSNPRRGSNP